MSTKVLVSRGFGSGWSTWNTEWDDLATDAGLVALVEEGAAPHVLEAYAEEKWLGCYTGGVADLYVSVVDTGDLWQLREYDGSESLVRFDSDNWNKG
jgi:hypothetical protein